MNTFISAVNSLLLYDNFSIKVCWRFCRNLLRQNLEWKVRRKNNIFSLMWLWVKIWSNNVCALKCKSSTQSLCQKTSIVSMANVNIFCDVISDITKWIKILLKKKHWLKNINVRVIIKVHNDLTKQSWFCIHNFKFCELRFHFSWVYVIIMYAQDSS